MDLLQWLRRCGALLAALLTVLALPGPSASATSSDEWVYAGFRDRMFSSRGVMGATLAPPIRGRDVRLFAEMLDLDAGQKEILRGAYEEFAREFLREAVLYEEARSDLDRDPESDGDWGEWYWRSRSMYEDLQRKSAAMEERLLADVRLMLRPEQMALWDRLEREQRRAKTLVRFASYPEEGFDLASCVLALELNESERERIEPLLEEYRMRIDAPLVARNRQAERVMQVWADWMEHRAKSHGRDDEATRLESAKHREALAVNTVREGLALRRACARVRDVNVEFKAQLEEELPQRVLEEFRELTMPETTPVERSFEHFARSEEMLKALENFDFARRRTEIDVIDWGGLDAERAEMMLRAVRTAPPLSEDQLERIEVIRADWKRRSEAIYAKYADPPAPDGEPDLIELPTPGGTLHLMRAEVAAGSSMYVTEDKDHPGWKELSRLDQEIVDRLRGVLTIEQRALFATM